MEVKFEVLLSSSIKRKKPWPKFCWLGKEKEGVFLLDDTRISEINLVSGQTKKKTPTLQPLLPRVVTMAGSQNGAWLVGLLVTGELFLWNRDKDSLKTVAAVSAVYELASAGKALRLSLLVSGDGQRVLLVSVTGQVFLWECLVPQDLNSPRDSTIRGLWTQIASSENAQLPSSKDKEASLHSVFIQSETVGDVCLSAFVFTNREELMVTILKIQWDQTWENKLRLERYSVQWVTKTFPLRNLEPPCRPVKSRGALVPAFSPDGQLLAIILNQKDPRATQVLYISAQNFVTVSSLLGGCGSKKLNIPAKYVRSYWVGCASWSPEGLYLACVLKRGSLLLLARLGGLVSLSTAGCDIEFGPVHFLPLHPLVTYRPPVPLQSPDDALSSSSVSLRDPMRQRYSVTWHPRLPCLLMSDGYMVTMLKMASRPSPTSLMSSVLLDTAQGLERVSRLLGSEQPQVRPRLESMSTLKFTASLLALKEKEIPASTLPLFLREGEDNAGLKLTIEKAQGEDDEEDSDIGQYTHSVMQDGGRLEFASMFDTLHAQHLSDPEDSEQDSSVLLEELATARHNILTAWAFGVSQGGIMDQRERLLKYTVSCAVRLARMLRIALPVVQRHREDKGTWTSHVFDLIRSLLCFLPWDSPHKGSSSCFRVIVDLVQCFVHFFLPLSLDSVCSSQNFTAALLVLEETSKTLDLTYSLPERTVQQEREDHAPCPSDMFFIPLLQESKEAESVTSQLLLPNRPSNRLITMWRKLYRQALQYQAKLFSQTNLESQRKEFENMSNIISQIQEALQRGGDLLEESPALHNITGEQHFILGEYSKCVQAWRVQLWAERERVGPRTGFLETRYCLALLFGQLFQYRLREAQALCDFLARRLQSQNLKKKVEEHSREEKSDEAHFEGWLPQQVNKEAACAVVQSLGRFMASYFTNQPLAIFPPHNVDILPPLHLPHLSGRRMVALSQSRVAGAVRSQHLSELWTVDYALELLLLGGLMPEAVWLAHSLGDWKTAASLGLAYTTYCRLHYDFSRLKWKELHLPVELHPGWIFQNQLESLMGCVASSDERGKDTAEVEDMDVLQASVQEILKASVMAEVDVVSQPLSQLLDSAKEHAHSFPMLVPPAFYLPAPPLYCPQPAPNTQDSFGNGMLVLERELRCHVAGVLQRVLLLFRAAHCSRPAAQWYISSLRRCRQIYRKVRKWKVESKDDLLPEGLKKFTNFCGFFRSGHLGHKDMDSVSKQTIVCFRELCGLCWMLHVRDQLTVSCRKYQTARSKSLNSQLPDVRVSELCEEALRWVCRLLPFSRFLCAEEVLQDLALSLVAELPPVPMVTETLVRMFPNEEESVRVPLRDKYSSMMHRFQTCVVQTSTPKPASESGGEEEEEGETMMLLIQDQRRQRCKEERRLAKNLAPLERHLWERDEGEEKGGTASMLSRFSLDTNLSNSTLTDYERPLVGSEKDMADTLSEPLSPDMQTRPYHSSRFQKAEDRSETSRNERNADGRSKSVTKGAAQGSVVDEGNNTGPTLPTVGTWVFELEDEEYLRFLELFYSYVLEKDSLDTEESELPLLSSFSSQLRERELHSDTFDMLTTLKRRKAGRKRDALLPVFCAGRCFHILPVTPEPTPSVSLAPSVISDAHTAQTSMSVKPLRGKQPGLFSLLQRRGQSANSVVRAEKSPVKTLFQLAPQIEPWLFKAVSHPDVDLQLELDSKLETQFPRLGRLFEWMLRWADRSVLVSQTSRKTLEGAGEPVVIRAKASAPAVLLALRLLEQRYTAGLQGTDKHGVQLKGLKRDFTVAPVLQPETGCIRERESSIDTGYPTSAETPITLHDLEPQQGCGSRMCEPEEIQDNHSISHMSGLKDVNSDSDISLKGTGRESELIVMCESEDNSSIEETLEGSLLGPDISVQIQTPSKNFTGSRKKALTLADLENTRRTEDSESESDCSSEGGGGAPVEPPEEETASSSVSEAPEPASSQQNNQHCSQMSNPPAALGTISHAPSNVLPQNGANTQPDPVRQLLQDELFRLVQLQQINFMSLMQVVGASFTNLPLSQSTNPLLAQLSMPGSQTAAPAQPQHHASMAAVVQSEHGFQSMSTQTSENIRQKNADGPFSKPQNRTTNIADEQRNSEAARPSLSPINSRLNPQENQQLTIRSDWPEDGQTEGRRFIPPSQGLLTTVENQTPPQAGLTRGRPNDRSIFNPPERTAPVMQGLKLLQLPSAQPPLLRPPPPPAPVREAWGAQTLHLSSTHHEPSVIRRVEEDRSRTSAEPTAVPPHLNLNQYTRQSPPQVLEISSERGAVGEALCLPPASHSGLRLLQFPPSSKAQPIQLPQIPNSAPVKQLTMGPAAVGPYPRLQLLRTEPEPPSHLQYAAPPVRVPRLIPLEELLGWAAGRSQGMDPKIQLLKTDILPERRTHTATPSRKRLKRREMKKREEKVFVTFRSDDSIIPPSQPEEKEPTPDAGYAIPLGSFDSVLSGERLLSEAYSTSAELHAFASTQKQAPEIQDACTNTEPASPRPVTDKAVSAQLAASPGHTSAHRFVDMAPVVPPDMFLNLRFRRDVNTKQPESSGFAETNVNTAGRSFISVIDLEDVSLLQDLPPSLPSFQTPAQTTSASPPTSAQLHLLAASVTNSAATNTELRTEEQDEELPGPSNSSPPAAMNPELEPSGDPVTLRVLMDLQAPEKSLSARQQRDSFLFSRNQVSARLAEMDAQLAALQDIADRMDHEFANTRLLVNTIETLCPAVKPVERDKPYSSTFRVLKGAKSFRHVDHHVDEQFNMEEEKKEEQMDESFLTSALSDNVSLGLDGLSSLHPLATSTQSLAKHAHTSAAVKPEQSQWNASRELIESSMDISGIPADNTLGLSGLSDVADILGDLVKQGALSPSALRLSSSVARQSSRLQEQQRKTMMDEETSELRTWMKKKQRERLVEYRKQREEKRERERKPFTPPVSVNPSSKDLTINKKKKEERDKMALLEHHSQRAQEACSLITDLLTAPLHLPTASSSTTMNQTRESRPRSQNQSIARSKKSPKGQRGRARSVSALGKTVVLQRRSASGPPGTLSSRLGLHRPGSALPGDRLSQVTRRGMLTDLRGRPRVKITPPSPHAGLNRTPVEQKTTRQKELSYLEDTEERDVVSPWDTPAEIRRILGLERNDREQDLEVDEQGRLGALSESTGSLLSKLDWADIERIVAEEEDMDC